MGLLFTGKRKLACEINSTVHLVSEEDGTEVTDNDRLATFPGNSTFLLLEDHENWLPRSWIMYGSPTIPDIYGTSLGKLAFLVGFA